MQKRLLSFLFTVYMLTLLLSAGARASGIEDAPSFTITTKDAVNVQEFSATLSMTITGDLYSLGKCVKFVGFQYCIGDEFSPAGSREWETLIDDLGELEKVDNTHFTYTGPVSCRPGTTYTYRAYLRIGYVESDEQLDFISDEVKTFTTPGASEELKTLNPGSSLSFDLTGGQSAYFLLGEDLSGFYKLSSKLPEGTEAWSELFMEEDGSWNSLNLSNEPVYLDGQPRYGKVTLNGSSAITAACSVTLSPYEIVELTDGGTAGPFSETAYLKFTPGASGGMYKLTFGITESTDANAGSLEQWGADTKRWIDYTLIGDGFAYLLSPKEGETCYLKLAPFRPAACTITVSKYTPVTEISVRSGTARAANLFSASIPVMGEIPDGYDSQHIRAGIEYKLGNKTKTEFASGKYPNTLWTVQCELDLFPGKEYQYRTFVEVRDEHLNVTDTIWEAEWHTFTAPPADPAPLLLKKNVFENAEPKFLSFTPEESGSYTISMEGWEMRAFWNAEECRWDREWNTANEPKLLSLTAGVPLYLQARPRYYYDATITVSRDAAAVTGFTVTTGETTTADLELRVPVTVTAPTGSKYNCYVQYRQDTGDRWLSAFKYVDSAATEPETFELSLPVWPGKTYTYRAYVYDRNERKYYYENDDGDVTHTIQMPELETEPTILTEGVRTPASGRAAYFFTPAKDGNYLFSAEGDSGVLTILWEDGTWERRGYYAGSTEIKLPFQASQGVYVIQEERGSGSVMVRPIVLSAVKDSNGQVAVSMDAEAAGQYIFAAYNQSGRLLASGIVSKGGNTAETLTATLAAGGDAAYVKAFQLESESYKPQVPPEMVPVEYRYN